MNLQNGCVGIDITSSPFFKSKIFLGRNNKEDVFQTQFTFTMRNRFYLRKFVNLDKQRFFSWNQKRFLRVCVAIAIISIPMKAQCSKSDMLKVKERSNKSNSSSLSSAAEITILSNSLTVKGDGDIETELSQKNNKTLIVDSTIDHDDKQLETEEDTQVQSIKPVTDATIVNTLLAESSLETANFTTPYPYKTEQQSLEISAEGDAEEREYVGIPSSTSEMESSYDEEEASVKSVYSDPAYDDETETNDVMTSIPFLAEKFRMPSPPIPLSTTSRVITFTSTPRSIRNKYPILKKVPSRLVAASSSKLNPTTKYPKTFITSTSKKPRKVTKTPRPGTPTPRHENGDPHHPHGIVIFDKRKKRPKPGRMKTRPTTTTTTTTTTTRPTTTTTIPSTTTLSPNESTDYYEYYWSGEISESNEITAQNSTNNNNSTSNKKRISSKIPLSKLAMAMIASSTVFDNGTDSEDPMYYPKTPVNLLNILQSYTKQLQLTDGESTVVTKPVVQIQSTPFMLQLSQLPFGTRVAISIYYSLIAIIPLVYLAFGGLGRLGFLGRGFGKRRRKRRSYGDDQYAYGLNSRYKNTVIQRADLNDRNEDEYMWILGRISEIILEFSLLSDEKEK